MKMKKTIAGVLAAMTAVSAMAATVSADQEEINLHYDLRTKVTTKEKAIVKIAETWAQSETNTYKVTPKSGYFEAVKGSGNWQPANYLEFGFNSTNSTVNFNDIKGATLTLTYKNGDKTNTVNIIYKDAGSITEADYLNGNVIPVVDGAIDTTGDGKANWTLFYKADVAAPYSRTRYVQIPVLGGVNQVNSVSGVDYNNVTSAVVTLDVEADGYFDDNLINGWQWWNNHASGDTANYFTGSELNWLGIPYTGEAAQSLSNVRNGLSTVQTAISDSTGAPAGVLGFAGFTAGSKKDHYFPLLSTTSVYKYMSKYGVAANQDAHKQAEKEGKALVTNDVIAAIRRSGSGTSPLSVINDAIANDYDVEFTFTSANGYVATLNSSAVLQWVNLGEAYDYEVKNSWHKTVFGQDLYSTKYSVASPYDGATFTPEYSYNASASYDSYGSFSSAWAQNLVSAGLVVNSELTMQLNDVQKLQWDANALTFHWDDIIDGKVTRANQILTTMLLYTPVDWYWDSLDVKVLKTETEDVNAGESIEEDGEILDEEIDEEAEEEVEEEEEVVEEEEEEYVEEEEVEEELPEVEVEEEPVETTAAPVEAAPSPKTGNAPIALAVIPVALAAAAVVAKKRG